MQFSGIKQLGEAACELPEHEFSVDLQAGKRQRAALATTFQEWLQVLLAVAPSS